MKEFTNVTIHVTSSAIHVNLLFPSWISCQGAWFERFPEISRNHFHPERVVSFKERAERGWKSGARSLSWKSGWNPCTLAATNWSVQTHISYQSVQWRLTAVVDNVYRMCWFKYKFAKWCNKVVCQNKTNIMSFSELSSERGKFLLVGIKCKWDQRRTASWQVGPIMLFLSSWHLPRPCHPIIMLYHCNLRHLFAKIEK